VLLLPLSLLLPLAESDKWRRFAVVLPALLRREALLLGWGWSDEPGCRFAA
jgi:hypothetical protein